MLTQAEVTAYVEELRRTDDDVDQDARQWERRRRLWAGRPHDRAPHITDTCRAYEEATGSRLGCD
jgi:hypothetical protein